MSGVDEGWKSRYGPIALVTGASDGIGRAMAQEAGRRGLDLVLVARREAALAALADDLTRRHGIRARVLALDLASPAARLRLADETEALDIGLVAACAGYGRSGPFLRDDPAGEHDMLAVNCAAALDLAQVFGGRLSRRGRGGLVLMSSIVAFQGCDHAASYAASKAYVQALAEGIRPEFARKGVSVLASAPGPVASGFAARAGMRMDRTVLPEKVARQTLDALGRAGTVRPGALSKLLGWSLSTLPRPLRVAVMGAIMKGMLSPADA